jgi:HNH endonuclease/Helix-turn-helix domain of resolvase
MTNEIKKLKFFPAEKVEILPVRRTLKGHKYAVTNYGRVIRFNKTPEDGAFIKHYLATSNKYPSVFIQNNGKRMNALIHRLVAQCYLPKPKKDQAFVIHKDRDNNNNHPSNLKWVTKAEHLQHAMRGDSWRNSYAKRKQYKLTEDRVRLIRKKIKEGKTRIKMIAKQFGVTDMQLYRIKSGENWGWVK